MASCPLLLLQSTPGMGINRDFALCHTRARCIESRRQSTGSRQRVMEGWLGLPGAHRQEGIALWGWQLAVLSPTPISYRKQTASPGDATGSEEAGTTYFSRGVGCRLDRAEGAKVAGGFCGPKLPSLPPRSPATLSSIPTNIVPITSENSRARTKGPTESSSQYHLPHSPKPAQEKLTPSCPEPSVTPLTPSVPSEAFPWSPSPQLFSFTT